MGFYNVVRPCVVGKLHYATVPVQPIEVDDDVAAPLVGSGCLKAYSPGSVADLESKARDAYQRMADSNDDEAQAVEEAVDAYAKYEEAASAASRPSPKPRRARIRSED